MTNSNDASAVEQALRIVRDSPGELLTIVGPTASGKTALALALAEKLGGEVISADSVQIYRGFDIGSGKPTAAELARAPHHLVGTLEPLEHVDAAGWALLADRAIADAEARGRVPILCGGTFLWIKALLFGLADAPAADRALRERHRAIVESEGRPALHTRLRNVDPEAADRLHPNDFVRVSRALEVHELTGKKMSHLQRDHGFARPRREARLLGIAREPEELTERMAARVHEWIGAGWTEEVETLIAAGYGNARAMASVGYAQVRAAVSGQLGIEDLEVAIVRATRIFARRQRTWLNRTNVTWLR